MAIIPIVTYQNPIRSGSRTSFHSFQYDFKEVWWKVRPRFSRPVSYQRFGFFGVYVPGYRGSEYSVSPSGIFTEAQLYQALAINGVLWDTSQTTSLSNTAYERMISKLRSGGDPSLGGRGPQAELGTTFAEMGQTASWLASASEAVRDYTEAIFTDQSDRRIAAARARVYASRRSRKKRKPRPLTRAQVRYLLLQRWAVPRWLSSRWLEYWMCVAPLMGDMQTALKVLSTDVYVGTLSGSASSSFTNRFEDKGSFDWRIDVATVKLRVRQQCDVRIVNPNLALAQGLGLLNPLTIVGELIPWTWFLGWFVNWKTVLGQWSDFAGYQIQYPYTTLFYQASGSYWGRTRWFDPVNYTEGSYPNYSVWGIVRRGGITPPKIAVTLPGRLSVSRAATAISLVVNMLTSKAYRTPVTP